MTAQRTVKLYNQSYLGYLLERVAFADSPEERAHFLALAFGQQPEQPMDNQIYPDPVAEARERLALADKYTSAEPYVDDPDLLRGLLDRVDLLQAALRQVLDIAEDGWQRMAGEGMGTTDEHASVDEKLSASRSLLPSVPSNLAP